MTSSHGVTPPTFSGEKGPRVTRDSFGVLPDGQPVDVYTLSNTRGMRVRFMSLGGTVLSLDVPDASGALDDVVLGYATLEAYLDDRHFIGPIVGRYANRIANGRFTIDDIVYELERNEGNHCLHGGAHGLHRKLWAVVPFKTRFGDVGAVLGCQSPAGECGFPGLLDVRVTYTLGHDNAFAIDYQAKTDAPTHVSLTQHMYFNLAGSAGGNILDHLLTIPASRFTAVTEQLIPTGKLARVDGTPFDFRTPHTIGARIAQSDEQLRHGNGYDHNFVLDRQSRMSLVLAARLQEPRSGRVMEVHTSEPGIQFYSGNSLMATRPAKHGASYAPRQGLALETQHFPDSPHHPDFPSTLLRPNEEYVSRTVYRFSTS